MQTAFGMLYSESGSDHSLSVLRRTRFKTRPGSGSSKSVLWIRIRIESGLNGVPESLSRLAIRIRIWIQEGKNDPENIKELIKNSSFELLDVLF
jgi:hypothetical protein